MDTKKQNGFTIIELVVVIIVLAILAAFAIPKYMNISTQSRISVVNGLYGSMQAAAELVRSLALAQGYTAATSNVNLGDGLVVSINSKSYPIADPTYGIGAVLGSTTGFTATSITSGVRYDLTSGVSTCSVSYVITTAQPTITPITSGC
jgi:MSHA pilin protein MshA